MTDYFAYQKHFEEKYGPETVVFIQKGTFYEIYEYDPQSDFEQTVLEELGGNAAISLHVRDNKIEDLAVASLTDLPNTSMGKARQLSIKLGLKLTSSDKGKPHSLENPYMVGVPVITYEERKEILLAFGFTIVRIDEMGDEVGKRNKRREITEITSPGTEINKVLTIQPTGTDSLVCIYIEFIRPRDTPEHMNILCGLTSIDVTTGRNIVSETYSKPDDEIYAIQEIYRFLSTQRPVEILLCLNKIPDAKVPEYMAYLEGQLDLKKYPLVITSVNQVPADYFKIEYQEAFLRKAFTVPKEDSVDVEIIDEDDSPIVHQAGTHGPAGMIDNLDLERLAYGRVSYLYLLQHCYEHRAELIRRLQMPIINWTDSETTLILAHNAVDQLDIFPRHADPFSKTQKGFDSLVSVVDMTTTSMGSRYLRRRLLNPIRDIERLNRSYLLIQELIDRPELAQNLRVLLKGFPDMERLHRKVQLKMITPREFATLLRAYGKIHQIYVEIFNACHSPDSSQQAEGLRHLLMSEEVTDEFNECFARLNDEIDLEKLDRVKYTVKGGIMSNAIMQCEESFITEGQDSVIDELSRQLVEYRQWAQTICDHLNGLVRGARCKKIEISQTHKSKKSDDDDGPTNLQIMLVTSAATVRHLTTANTAASGGINRELCGYLEFHKINANETVVRSERIDTCVDSIIALQSNLESQMLRKYQETIAELSAHNYFGPLNLFICELDFILSNALTATKYRYFRPVIDTELEDEFALYTAYIKAKNLRHPLIERIIRTEYIPNDVTLGRGFNGILQYGVNSAGKTSLAKSLGIAIIMAQAGMFVAGEIVYYPYSKIITRLSGHDDLLKGQSSFVVEMMELKTILRNSDRNTFVLGDELCRGTESISGHGLTVSTIEVLIARKASFIFSTHMHGLVQMKPIQDQVEKGRLRICHLSTHYSQRLHKLVYDRKIRDGSGSEIYGLEVCRSLNLPSEFIQRSQEISRTLLEKEARMAELVKKDDESKFVSDKKSRYNSRVYVDKCSFCNTKLDLQTHHLKHQSTADESGFIDYHHKNANFNLLVLCESCHQKLHQNGTHLQARQTLEGVYLGEPSPASPSSAEQKVSIIEVMD